jgi:Raf kinase inhibitor-like YbhB/YbcL family protein
MTSSAVPTNGAFANAYTCMGADTSPDLEWSPGTSEPQSYAVELSDAATGAVQWIVWDIPATVTSLPAGLPATAMLSMPAGAKQVSTSGNGYVGPCPPSNQQHFYEFTLFALPVPTLAGVTTDSPPSAVATAINLTPPIDIAFFGASAGTAPLATGGVAGSN